MIVLDFLSTNYTYILFAVSIVIIILFTDLSIDKIVVVVGLVGVCIVLYKMITNSSSMLVVGLVGIILVLLFALASGVGRSQRPVIIKEDCKPKRLPKLTPKGNCPLSGLDPAGMCPNGFTNFTDGEGNTLCCASSNIDPYSHKCPASGPNGICSMAPGLEDRRSPTGDKVHYPMCQNVRREQTVSRGAAVCPSKYPHYLQMQNSAQSYKCCATSPGSSATQCPNPAASCSNLFGAQTVFTSPDSCEALKLQSTLKCPSGTSFNPKMQITDPKSKRVIFVPACQGITNTCYPRKVLNKCTEMGGCSGMNMEKTLSNCDVYNSLFNDRSIDLTSVDITGINFFD
jgi:hypothetical protein